MSYTIVKLNEQYWQVSPGIAGTDSEVVYDVIKVHPETCPEKCRILCRSCKTCPHVFECTCYDFLFAMNMCKHIHYVLLKSETTNDEGQRPDVSIEISAIEEFLPQNSSVVQNEIQDQELINSLDILISLVKNPLLARKDEDAAKLQEIVNLYIPKYSCPIDGPREPHNKMHSFLYLLYL